VQGDAQNRRSGVWWHTTKLKIVCFRVIGQREKSTRPTTTAKQPPWRRVQGDARETGEAGKCGPHGSS